MKTVVVGVQLALYVLFFLLFGSDGAPGGGSEGDGASGSGSVPESEDNYGLKPYALAAFEIMFNCFDKNKDGKITKADLTAPIDPEKGESPLTDAELQVCMSTFGKDEDGEIEFSEYLRTMSTLVPTGDAAAEWEKEMEELFKFCHITGENYVSLHELSLATLHTHPVKLDIRLFGWADQDGDGELNIEEFKTYMFLLKLEGQRN